MFKAYFETLSNCFKIEELRGRIWFTLGLLVICRVIALIPIPGLDGSALTAAMAAMAEKQRLADEASGGGGMGLLQMYSLFTGGALERCAIGSLGIMPYISATIILQLMTAVVPSLSKLAREEGGRTQIIKYGRYLTVVICLGQGFVMSMGWENPASVFRGAWTDDFGQLVAEPGMWYRIQTTLMLTTGTLLLMWLGEQITDRGVGNGVSLVITIGIIARVDQALQDTYRMFQEGQHIFMAFGLILMALAVVAAVIAVTQAQRKIPVQYAQRAVGRKVYQGASSFLPLRVNYAGVMPIIFAQAILMFPQQILGGLGRQLAPTAEGSGFMFSLGEFLTSMSDWFVYASPTYLTIEGLMILFFAYFWVATQFNETQIADDLKKYGGYIPGVRPGVATRDFLHHAMSRLTLAGGLFLVAVAILPAILYKSFNVPFSVGSFFGGTSVLIAVGVMLDTMRQLESHLNMRHYDGFLKKGKIRGRNG